MSARPLNEYLDMEAYDVVAGQTYRDLREQLETYERALFAIARGDYGLFNSAADFCVRVLGHERCDALEAADSSPASRPSE